MPGCAETAIVVVADMAGDEQAVCAAHWQDMADASRGDGSARYGWCKSAGCTAPRPPAVSALASACSVGQASGANSDADFTGIPYPPPMSGGQEQRFEIEVTPEIEAGVHADFTTIWHTPDTFVLDFASLRHPPHLSEDAESGQQTVILPTRITARVKIAAAQVFELMKALEIQLSMWERETGRRPPDDGESLPGE